MTALPMLEQHALIEEHLHRVPAIASGFKAWLPRHVEFGELVSCGNVRLVQCARRFEPGRSVPFGAFADVHIRGAMMDYLRACDLATRRERRMGVEDTPYAVPLDAALLTCRSEDRGYRRSEARADLLPVIKLANLPRNWVYVITQIYWLDRTQSAIASDMGLSAGRVSQIEKAALRRLRLAARELRLL